MQEFTQVGSPFGLATSALIPLNLGWRGNFATRYPQPADEQQPRTGDAASLTGTAERHAPVLVSPTLMDPAAYNALYPPQLPSKPADAPDAHRLLTHEDGVGTLPTCADSAPSVARPGQRHGRHLWAIGSEEVRVILEVAPQVRPPPLSLGVAKHTNLTGGEPASCGGELWFDSVGKGKLYANGGSGRYPARSPKQLEDAMKVLAGCGFEVISAGWSYENDCPERVFR